ncbi:outer membrane lipoprotein chaperone LolA [Rhodoferax sp.]|uniref:outer membrane lipoprotein chaperone LolA n=1 Tax=Rhodoferax sp. TaxID=50421 RepID=UPI0026036908|nr:outer membrane lipoprotein chaperone LolA [Rhodoferax sp.]MDD2917638.1 outer membrane lipoprotein chaperone LolA [Rhodoferax sp.]
MKRFLLTAFLMMTCAAGAGGLSSLETFVRTVKTGQATFTQVVTSPAREGQAPRVKTSSGQFEFARPNRFRFDYAKPFVQTIVADGHTLWLHDVDLNQVTARKQAAVLDSTPAALIASAADVQALQADFVLADAPDKDGLQWVLATPKSKDGQLQSVRVGFRAAGEVARQTVMLEVLEILDNFGQRSVLTFKGFKVNPSLPASSFQFSTPKGADLIRQ